MHISFGNKADFDKIKRNFPDQEVDHPMDGIEEKAQQKDNGKSKGLLS